MTFSSIRQSWDSRLISVCLMVTFVVTMVITPKAVYAQATAMAGQAGVMGLPEPGTMVDLSPAYVPVMITGLTVHPENPLLMDFIVSTGNSGLNALQVKKESDRLIKYFLACLTIPENNQWVNLSPYEKQRIVPQDLGQTVLGQDMLEQDYLLKQLTASLIYPEKNLGKNFWDKVYAKASQMYGTTQIPVNTFNKVWILPQYAKVFEHKDTVFVVKSHLKVMLDEDYLALNRHSEGVHSTTEESKGVNNLGSQIVRQIILPAIEKEVNTGKNFAQLRQIYNSMILAVWFKKNLKQALLNQVYTDKSKVSGVNVDDPSMKEKIYQQYLLAYKKGVFNYIKEEVDQTNEQTIPRKYFSGGITAMSAAMLTPATADETMSALNVEGDNFRVSGLTQGAAKDDAMMNVGEVYQKNRQLFTNAGVEVGERTKIAFFSSFASTLEEINSKVSGGEITSRSVLSIDGANVHLNNVYLDGELDIKVAPGVYLTISDVRIINKGDINRKVIDIQNPGNYVIRTDGKLEKVMTVTGDKVNFGLFNKFDTTDVLGVVKDLIESMNEHQSYGVYTYGYFDSFGKYKDYLGIMKKLKESMPPRWGFNYGTHVQRKINMLRPGWWVEKGSINDLKDGLSKFEKQLESAISNRAQLAAKNAAMLTQSTKEITVDLESSRNDKIEAIEQNAPSVFSHVRTFLGEANSAFEEAKALPEDQIEAKNIIYIQILSTIQKIVALPQLVLVESEDANTLSHDVTELWIKLGETIEQGRVNAIKTLIKTEGVGNSLEKRMGEAHIVFENGNAKIEDLQPDAWSPYSSEIWAPYLVDTLAELLRKTDVNLDEQGKIILPEKIGRLAIEPVRNLVASTDPVERLKQFVKIEGDVRKDPSKGLQLAQSLGWGEIQKREDFEHFMQDFLEAMRLMKWTENWESKKEAVLEQRQQWFEHIKSELGLNDLDTKVFAARVVSRNIPFDIIEKIVNKQMPRGENYREQGSRLIKKGYLRMLSVAGGSASRWKTSLADLIHRGLIDPKQVPDNLPRALAAYWLGNYADGGETGVSLTLNNLALLEKEGYNTSLAYILSPYTWKDFMKATYETYKNTTNKPRISVIAQNSGTAQVLQDGIMTDEDLPGKVLGHGNVRGWLIGGVIDGLKNGVVFDLTKSADNPFTQLNQPQVEEIIGRMAQDHLAHVALGNWRSIGQAGGGFVNQQGVANVIDTAISNKPNSQGFLANRDINVFSTFTNFINNAAVLYAVSSKEDNLISWNQFEQITEGNAEELAALQTRLERLAPEQLARFTNKFIDLLPSEFVKKSEGKTFVQWEQISGMLHGALPKAIRERQAKDGETVVDKLNLAYVDISRADYRTLNGKGAKAADVNGIIPMFIEVKGAPDLEEAMGEAGALTDILASRGVFDFGKNEAMISAAAASHIKIEKIKELVKSFIAEANQGVSAERAFGNWLEQTPEGWKLTLFFDRKLKAFDDDLDLVRAKQDAFMGVLRNNVDGLTFHKGPASIFAHGGFNRAEAEIDISNEAMTAAVPTINVPSEIIRVENIFFRGPGANLVERASQWYGEKPDTVSEKMRTAFEQSLMNMGLEAWRQLSPEAQYRVGREALSLAVNAAMTSTIYNDAKAAVLGEQTPAGRLFKDGKRLAGMAFIFGTGNNGTAVDDKGNIITYNDSILELGHNIIRDEHGRWRFTGKESRGGKPVLAKGESTFEENFSGINIARRFINGHSNAEHIVDSYYYSNGLASGLSEIENQFHLIQSDISSDSIQKEKQKAAVDNLLKALTDRFSVEQLKGEEDTREVVEFVNDLGHDIGQALSALFIEYVNEPWVENFIMVSGVGENFARVQTPLGGTDMFVDAIREGVAKDLYARGADPRRVSAIANGVRRSNMGWEREAYSAALTDEDIRNAGVSADAQVYSIGYSIGGTKVGAALLDRQGQAVATYSVEWTGKVSGANTRDFSRNFVQLMIDMADVMLHKANIHKEDVIKSGIAFAGSVNEETGVVGEKFAPVNLPLLQGVNLPGEFKKVWDNQAAEKANAAMIVTLAQNQSASFDVPRNGNKAILKINNTSIELWREGNGIKFQRVGSTNTHKIPYFQYEISKSGITKANVHLIEDEEGRVKIINNHVNAVTIELPTQVEEVLPLVADKAMVEPGGIDLNSKNLNMESTGQKVNITFDPAMIAQFRRGDFSGVKIQILDVVPINLMPLLGLKEDEESGRLAKV